MSIEVTFKKYRDTHEYISYFWLPSILIFISSRISLIESNFLIIDDEKLEKSLKSSLIIVNDVLSSSKEIGFIVVADKNDKLLINFLSIFPSHIYGDISLLITRFLRYEFII
jgi:hypothetical protein